MRYLGVDYGKKRIGTAVADEETGIATPRGVTVRTSDTEAIEKMTMLVREERIKKIIVGLALAPDGGETEISRAARAFGGKLGAATGLSVDFENEIFTTRMTEHEGVTKQNADAASAAIILQSYLDKRHS